MAYLTTCLANGLKLPELDAPPLNIPNSYDAITGEPITRGYPSASVVSSVTSIILDAFREGSGLTGYVSVDTARVFKSANPRTGNPCARSLLVFEDVVYSPLIAREAARTQNRPCWSDLVREVWPARKDAACGAILTTNTKRRLWPDARMGALGDSTPILYYDTPSDGHQLLKVSWPVLIHMLDGLEPLYGHGYTKRDLKNGLTANFARINEDGYKQVAAWEAVLSAWRGRPEFQVALLMAQKPDEATPDVAPGATEEAATEVGDEE